jgi:hypothetical protein
MGHSGLSQEGQGGLEDSQRRMDVSSIGPGDGIPAAEVGPKQLIGTIEQVKTHDPDPTADAGSGHDPWDAVSSEFGELKSRLADTYRRVANDHGPTEDEIREAFSTLAGAWDQIAESVTTALKDPDVQEKLKDAAGSFATAFGATMSELGSVLRDSEESGVEEE